MESVIKYESSEVAKVVTDKDIEDYLFGTNTKLTESQKTLFIAIAKASNLNPILREIYPVPYEKSVKIDGKWTKVVEMAVITGYQVYIQRAEDTGLLGGYRVDVIKNKDKILGARIVIIRKDWQIPFEFEVNFDEFAKKDNDGNLIGFWAQKPEFAIKKCAIGVGFRLAFSKKLGTMPYIAEEMSGLSFEDIQERNKELWKELGLKGEYPTGGIEKEAEVIEEEKMSIESKKEIMGVAKNNKEIVMQALKELNLNKDNLLETDKINIINKIKELQNEEN